MHTCIRGGGGAQQGDYTVVLATNTDTYSMQLQGTPEDNATTPTEA
jgi:hypothetical protein